MKIAYIANARMPTEKAHGLQIMHMCRAFSQIGHDVTLIVPKRKNWIDKSIWEFYGAEPDFKMIQVPVVDFIVWDRWLGNWALWLTTLWFGKNARRVIEDLAPDVIYSRDPFSSAWTPRSVPHVFEAHTFPNRFLPFYRWLWKKCDRIVTVTEGLKKMFVEQGIEDSRLRVAADAVDLEAFAVSESKEAGRQALNLPADKFLVVYAGHLYPYKGIPDLMAAAQWLKPDIRLVIVGGRTDDLERTRAMVEKFKLTNVILVGRVPHKDVPRYLHAADLAVMPYTRESHHVEYYSSPLKLFEYLAAGRAIVSTDLPSVREVLDDRTAVFVPPENPRALADGLNATAGNPARLAELEKSSAELAKRYTWKNRAEAVLAALPKPRVEWQLTFYRKYRLEIHLSLLALAIRLAYVTLFPQHPIEGGDSTFYLYVSDVILGRKQPTPGVSAMFYYPPVYPAFLAAVRAIFGDAIVWIRSVQAVFSALTVFLMMLIARRWVSAYAAWIAGLIGALYVPMILESGILYTETTYTLLLTLGIYLFLRMRDSTRMRDALLAGSAFALAGLTRELGMYTALLLAIPMAFRKKTIRLAAVFAIPLIMASVGLSVRNQMAARSQQFPAVPLLGKGYELTLQVPFFQQRILAPDRLYLYLVGVFKFFRFPFRLLDISDGAAVKEIVRQGDWRQLRLNFPEFMTKTLLLVFHWILLALAALGVWRGSLKREAKIAVILVIAFAAFSIILAGVGRERGFATYEPLARYRFPIEPLIIVLAASGIEYWSRKREARLKDVQ